MGLHYDISNKMLYLDYKKRRYHTRCFHRAYRNRRCNYESGFVADIDTRISFSRISPKRRKETQAEYVETHFLFGETALLRQCGISVARSRGCDSFRGAATLQHRPLITPIDRHRIKQKTLV